MKKPPILVTGTHRSGTTWVGRTLCLSPMAQYVHEPFAPMNHRSWLASPPTVRYLYQAPDADGPYVQDLRRIVELRPRWLPVLRRAKTLRDVANLGQEVASSWLTQRRGGTAVIKDPFSLLSAEWLQKQTNGVPIVLVRHPAGFVSSVKRLQWRLDETWLLRQSDLMAQELSPFRAELAAAQALDIIDHSCLIWRVLNSVVARLEGDHPDWRVLRYEDLALDPVNEFESLYAYCGLPWEKSISDRVASKNSAANPTEVTSAKPGETSRNSREAIWTWHDRLSPEEIERVRTSTEDIASYWYKEDRWWL